MTDHKDHKHTQPPLPPLPTAAVTPPPVAVAAAVPIPAAAPDKPSDVKEPAAEAIAAEDNTSGFALFGIAALLFAALKR